MHHEQVEQGNEESGKERRKLRNEKGTRQERTTKDRKEGSKERKKRTWQRKNEHKEGKEDVKEGKK